MSGNRFTWPGKIQHVWLDPQHNPYAIWRLLPPGLPDSRSGRHRPMPVEQETHHADDRPQPWLPGA